MTKGRENMRRARRWWAGGSSLMLALVAACVPEIGAEAPPLGTTSPEPVGEIQLSLTAIPSDALCLRVTVTGAQQVQRLFDLTPGRGTLLTMSGVPEGSVTVSEEAFGQTCDSLTDSSTANWVTEAPVAATVTAGRTTQVTVTLRRTGRVRLDNNFDASAIAVEPTSADLGAVTIGGSSRTLSFTITNVGQVGTGGLQAAIVGRDVSEFSITGNQCSALGTGRVCVLTVVFRPVTAGMKSAALQLSANPGGRALAGLQGTGLTPPALVMTPIDGNFGTVPAGTTVGPVSFSVRNTGQSPAINPLFDLTPTSPGSLAFRVVSNGCNIAALPPASECVLGVRATASTIMGSGTVQTATLSVTSMDGATAASFLRLTIR
ncbi:MAG TPA: choice-of-anchor D domain-containing protein [Polyangia bacterium]|nr:choice-of-anchor D domain-containing protein [Polyangia bacterium]